MLGLPLYQTLCRRYRLTAIFRKVDTRPTAAVVGGTASCRSLICRQLITQFLQASKPSKIVLISVTPDPSGALQDFCKSKKVKRIHVATISEAKLHLKRLHPRNKIVIETGDLTPALGAKDPMLELFVDRELDLEILSVLPAVHQSEVLRSSARHIEHLPITGVIISRISEAVSLGAVLDNLVAGKAPLIGMSRDFDSIVHPISPHSLIGVAKKLARGKWPQVQPIRCRMVIQERPDLSRIEVFDICRDLICRL